MSEQSIQYFKPLPPFARFAVSSEIRVSENKWIHYRHTFHTHPDDVKAGKKSVIFADIDCKSVIKKRSGETVRPSELLEHSDFLRDLLKEEEAGPEVKVK